MRAPASEATELEAALVVLADLERRVPTPSLLSAAEAAYLETCVHGWPVRLRDGVGLDAIKRALGRRPTQRQLAALAVVGREVARLEERQSEAARALWDLAAAQGTPDDPALGLRGELAVRRGEAAAIERVLAELERGE